MKAVKQSPRCISVKCSTVDAMFSTQYQIEDIILSHRGIPDGGGSAINGEFVRDIYFNANEAQFKAIKQQVEKRGFKIVKI